MISTRVRLCSALFVIVIISAVASIKPASAQVSHHDVTVTFDPETRQITVSDVVTNASDAISLDRLNWLELVELRIDDQLIGQPTDPITLPQSEVANRPVHIKVRGRLPKQPGASDRFAALPTGAFLFGARGWLPTAGKGSAIYRVTVEVPRSHRGVVTGTFKSEQLAPETYRAQFHFEGNGDDLAIFFGPYVVNEAFLGDIRLRTYFPQEHVDQAGAYLEAVARYITRYEVQIGDYPFDGFSVVSAPIPVGYALDGMTYVSERILAHPYMRGRSLAHEILHGWWGGGVRIDYERGNWGEGLTTYLADYALAEDQSAEAAFEMRREWLRNLSTLPNAINVRARDFRSPSHGGRRAVGYDKVALIFHMLRRELGDAAFTAGLRGFWEKSGQTASWIDLRAAFEKASRRDLDWFFTQWLDRPGLPSLALKDATITLAADGYALTVVMTQSAPTYRLTVPIAIETTNGMTTREIQLDDRETQATFALETRPLAVQIDPELHVARQLPRGEVPPAIREALRANSTITILSANNGERSSYVEAAQALAAKLVPKATLTSPEKLEAAEGAAVVIGTTAAVAAFRASHFETSPPAVATDGRARGWVERDPRDRLWLFISADSPVDLSRLAAVRYYGRFSHAVFSEGRRAATGTWPVTTNPLRQTFD